MRKPKKIIRFLTVFLVIFGISFSNIPFFAISGLVDSYTSTRDIVDKMWSVQKNDRDVVDNFSSLRNLSEKIRVHEAKAAAPTVVNKGTAASGTSTSVSPAYPSSINANDIVFILAISNQPNGIGVINTPSGFTQVAQGTYQNSSAVNRGRSALFWKRAAGGESGTVAVTRSGDSGTDGSYIAQMYRVSGAITSGDPWDAATPRYGPGNATVTWDAVTVSGSERTLLAFAAQADNASTVDPPSTYSGLVTDVTASGTDSEVRLLYKQNVSSDGQVTATGGETEGWTTFHVSMKPPSNTAPTLTVTQPDGASDTVTVGDPYDITYDLTDPEQTVTADFYYDTNNTGLDGTAITGCQDQAEGPATTCAWDTTGMTPGSYYVYGRGVDDGIAAEVSDYSSGQITINAPSNPDATSLTNVTEGGLTDGARNGQVVTITGSTFGNPTNLATCTSGTTNGCIKIGGTGGTTLSSGDIVCWNTGAGNCSGGTKISFTLPSGFTGNYGGATTSGLIVYYNGNSDTNGLTFYVYPDITSTTPAAGTGAKEGDSITITGTRFGGSAGTIEFINCAGGAVTASGTWGDTSITNVTVPAGIDDNDDSCDLKVTQNAGVGGQKADTLTGFIILPEITGLSVCASCNAASGREYNAGDTDGVISLNGKHFGTSQGANGKVEFTGGFGTVLATIHGTAEGACGTSGWAAAGTSVCAEVSSSISNSVYTGTITLTRNDLKTNVWSNFRVLPRITTNTPSSGVVADTVTIDGDHFCQSGTCPPSPPTAADTAEFGSTDAIASDFVTSCSGGSKWSHTQVCAKVPAGTPTGSQPSKITSNTSYVSNTKAFTVQSTVPNDPTDEKQYKSNGTTLISTGGTTDESTVVLKADLAASLAINMALQVEVKGTGTGFDGTGLVEGTVGTGGACTSCTTLNDAQVTISGLSDGTKHWRARIRNTTTSETSGWISYGGNADGETDFRVDTSAPTITFSGGDTCSDATGNLTSNSVRISWTLNESADGQVEYSTSSDLSGSTNYPSSPAGSSTSHQIDLSNLNSGVTYYFKVKSRDSAGNLATRPTSTPFCSFTTSSVTQPGKSTSFHIAGNTGSISAATNFYFSVLASETSVTVKNAYVEVTAIVSGGSTLSLKVNDASTKNYTVTAASPTTYRLVYEIPAVSGSYPETRLNLNDITPCTNDDSPGTNPENPPCNTLTVTPGSGMTVYIASAKVIITYGYTP